LTAASRRYSAITLRTSINYVVTASGYTAGTKAYAYFVIAFRDQMLLEEVGDISTAGERRKSSIISPSLRGKDVTVCFIVDLHYGRQCAAAEACYVFD
jgi:hypothetical protein